MYRLKSTVARVRHLAHRQQMNVSMPNPWHGFVADVLHSTAKLRCFANEHSDVLENRIIKVRTNDGALEMICSIVDNIRMINNVIVIVIMTARLLLQAAIVVKLVAHQFIMLVMIGIKCRWYN